MLSTRLDKAGENERVQGSHCCLFYTRVGIICSIDPLPSSGVLYSFMG